MKKYGDKRDYPKIDIFVNGKYECSTTWAKNLTVAKKIFIDREYKSLFMAKAKSVTTKYAGRIK